MPYPFLFQNATTQTLLAAGAYCRAEDVQALFKNISGFSTLDADEIMRRIADSAVEIDALLRPAYVTPVSGDADALTLLRLVNSRLAAAVIGEVYFRQSQPAAGPTIATWRTYAMGMIAKILAGEIRFLTAPQQPGGSMPEFPQGEGATFNSDDDADVHPEKAPLFQRTGRGNSLRDLI